MHTPRPSRRHRGLALLAGLGLLVAGTPPAGSTERISLSASGAELSGNSTVPAMSAKGRYVAFASADGVVDDDDNGFFDVFVRDRKKGTVSLVSVASDGTTKGNGESSLPAVSPNGRLIAFSSGATGLVLGDTNAEFDIFVHDRIDGTTSRVSVSTEGAQGDDSSALCGLSSTGRYVVFSSFSTNLVPDDSNDNIDVFVRDRKTGTTTRASVSSDGTQGSAGSSGMAITPNGRYVAMITAAPDLVLGDSNGKLDVIVRDLKKGLTTRESVSSEGEQADDETDGLAPVQLSANGRFVAFASLATNLVGGDTNGLTDVFVRDRKKGLTTRVSVSSTGTQATGASNAPTISASGRFVAFISAATDLVDGDDNAKKDIFVHDRKKGLTVMASVSPAGAPGDTDSGAGFLIALSANGRLVAFDSDATNLVDDDENAKTDVFLRDLKK